jgi:hypothetical protein
VIDLEVPNRCPTGTELVGNREAAGRPLEFGAANASQRQISGRSRLKADFVRFVGCKTDRPAGLDDACVAAERVVLAAPPLATCSFQDEIAGRRRCDERLSPRMKYEITGVPV